MDDPKSILFFDKKFVIYRHLAPSLRGMNSRSNLKNNQEIASLPLAMTIRRGYWFNRTLSDSYFYRSIVGKHQRGQRNPYKFPMMIFYKNAGSILRKICLTILLKPHFDIRNNLFSLFLKSFQNMKLLFSWFATEKFISSPLKSILNLNEALRYETVLRLLRVVNTPASIGAVHSQPLNYLQIIKTQTRAMGNSPTSGGAGKYTPAQSVFEHKSPGIFSRFSFLPKNNETIKSWMQINKPHMRNIESSASDSMTFQRRAVLHENSEDFYFHKRQNIEREVEEIKRVIVETKEAVVEKSQPVNFPNEMDMKRHLDINRISDHVYQNIERRIRMERERRGM